MRHHLLISSLGCQAEPIVQKKRHSVVHSNADNRHAVALFRAFHFCRLSIGRPALRNQSQGWLGFPGGRCHRFEPVISSNPHQDEMVSATTSSFMLRPSRAFPREPPPTDDGIFLYVFSSGRSVRRFLSVAVVLGRVTGGPATLGRRVGWLATSVDDVHHLTAAKWPGQPMREKKYTPNKKKWK